MGREHNKCRHCGRRSERVSLGLSCFHCGRTPDAFDVNLSVMTLVLVVTIAAAAGAAIAYWLS